MLKFVFDADAAIKLAKSGVLEKITLFAKCIMPKQVYEEVLKGKEKMYEDAFIVEELVHKNKISVATTNHEQINGLGAGECAALRLFEFLQADAIISDDRKFLSLLELREIPFITPIDAVALLALKHKITKQDAINALNRLHTLVRKENYQEAMKTIGGI
ncbi:hypothetical protein HY485_05605 [Candidatus Woesearchaeota archaeon]|nr:hypothetical protein [Candidatus Woesearchaeota archaeon]